MIRSGWHLAVVVLALAAFAGGCDGRPRPRTSDPQVTLERIPGEGLQPQAATGPDGRVHLVFLRGEPSHADVFYAVRTSDGHWSTPVRVNSTPGTAVATGTVRGAHVAIGRDGRVHVSWTGAAGTGGGKGDAAVFYSRSLAGALREGGQGGATTIAGAQGPGATIEFEPQRNLVAWAHGVDGGGSIAADRHGHVYVVWHAGPSRAGEGRRVVVLTRSDDDGKTFGRETSIGLAGAGACACCWLRALADDSGHLWVLYRAARNGTGRDVVLLSSSDRGNHVSGRVLQRWTSKACPLSTFDLARTPDGVVAAWEQGTQVHLQRVSFDGVSQGPIEAPGHGSTEKHPVVAVGPSRMLVAWTVDTAWARGGTFAWRSSPLNARDGGSAGSSAPVPPWSLVSAVALQNGKFLLLY